jgi:CRISPR-associated protein (TIGR02584 family)
MENKVYREILIFVTGTTPQIITETLYALTQEWRPPVFPDEIHVITTVFGRERVMNELIVRKRLSDLLKDYCLPPLSFGEESIHVVPDSEGQSLVDIRLPSHNEAVGDFIVEFIREKTRDMGSRLHCSLAGGRKTMSFYLGSALQLFGRPWDKLYHVLVSPEFESHPDFYYKPARSRRLKGTGLNGKVVRELHTRDAQILLAELPFIRLRDKVPLGERSFRELVLEGQREIDVASVQPALRLNLKERVVYIGSTGVDMVPIQMLIYAHFLRRKTETCQFSERPYCQECTECFPVLTDLSKRKTLEGMARDYRQIYGPSSGRVEEFLNHWERRGGVDQDTLRQNISKINKTLEEAIGDETLLPYFKVTAMGKHGSKRYGVRVEKRKISVE